MICASVNEVIVHGIPGSRVLHEGDVIGIDCGAIIEGWHGDAAFTAGVGTIAPEAKRLIEATEQGLAAAIDAMRAGNTLGDVGWAVQQVAERAGYGIVDGYSGHGIGRAMHEEPDVPNVGRARSRPDARARRGAGDRADVHAAARRTRRCSPTVGPLSPRTVRWPRTVSTRWR